jgi:hypothetical protein
LAPPKWTPPGFHPEGGRIRKGSEEKPKSKPRAKDKDKPARNASDTGPR